MVAYIYPFLTSNLTPFYLKGLFTFIYNTTPEYNHNDYIRDLATYILTRVKQAIFLQVFDIKLPIFEEKAYLCISINKKMTLL